MKKIQYCALALLLGSGMLHAKEINTKSSEAEKIGYSFGYLLGHSNVESLKNLNLDALALGLKTAAAGQTATLSNEEMALVLSQFKRQNEAKELLEIKAKAERNAQIGQAFLTENAKKAGVKTTASGLQYLILTEGTGRAPKAASRVKVHYEGTLIDGTIFDSSIARQQPVEFQLSQVIQGWVEGLQLMKPGAKYRFFIPSHLGYGQIGSGDSIEPNSTLIFDVELIEVLK